MIENNNESPSAAWTPPTNPIEVWTHAQRCAFYDGLRDLQAACGSDRHQQAFALINACIDEGIVTVGHVIKTLELLGFDRGHIGSILTAGRRGWFRMDDHGILSSSHEEGSIRPCAPGETDDG